MTCTEYSANLQLAAAAQRAHVGAPFAKRRPACYSAPGGVNWRRVALSVVTATPVLASVIIRFT